MTEYSSKFSLKGKTVFVCGGLGLLGKEISYALSSVGGRIVILDIDDAKGASLQNKLTDLGYIASFEHFDATDLAVVEKKIDELVVKFGGVDVWINCAYPRTPDWGNSIDMFSARSLCKNVEMHLGSYVVLSRKIAFKMRELGSRGSIVNFGSIYGVVGNDFSIYEGTEITAPIAYPAIKGGIISTTRYLASLFGEFEIRVNTICPGGVLSDQSPEFQRKYGQRVPLRRMGRPDEIAAAVLFLSSDASSYITGATIMVDGGWTAI